MARITDGRTIDNGTAHMELPGAAPALAMEIRLDCMLGFLRAADCAATPAAKLMLLYAAACFLDAALA